jgi:nicotinate-nucleotide adenylyltransferase
VSGLALFGGAFNPPHLTHRKIIAAARDQLPVTQVVVLPAGSHPHKQESDDDMAPPAARLELCELAFGDIPQVQIDDRELRREGLSYTVDTLRELRDEQPTAALYWIIGSDNLPLLHTWREPDKIQELCTIVSYPRKGHMASPTDPGIRLDVTLDATSDDVSASAIRDALRSGRQPQGLDPRVLQRIRQLGLYGT